MVLGFVFAVLFVAWLLYRRSSKKASKVSDQAAVIEAFAAESVARAVARRGDLEKAAVLAAFEGKPEPEVVGRVEELVRDVELAFERVPAAGPVGIASREPESFDVRVRTRFEDGSTAESTRRTYGNELPQSVRDEFQRTGGSRVFRTWEMPWSR